MIFSFPTCSSSPAARMFRQAAGLMILLICTACFAAGDSIPSEVPETGDAVYAPPVFEIYPPEDIAPHRDIPVPAVRPGLPRIAIIIDDIGYDAKMVEKLISLDAVITFSLFPASPFRDRIVRRIADSGMEMMLHLPMEPDEYPSVRPGPGALVSDMTPEDFMAQLSENLDAVPGIQGVNNHMGSRLTTIPTLMYRVFSVLKQRQLFFIDSYTSSRSICRTSARVVRIPFARRDVFLDHVQDYATVREQLYRLVRIAEAYGEAVGIGHPHEVTWEVLRDELPAVQERVRLVRASRIVHTSG